MNYKLLTIGNNPVVMLGWQRMIKYVIEGGMQWVAWHPLEAQVHCFVL